MPCWQSIAFAYRNDANNQLAFPMAASYSVSTMQIREPAMSKSNSQRQTLLLELLACLTLTY